MDTRLFEVDPQAGIAYGMYSALKKNEASFEDFLLHYDSHSVNEKNDNSWLTKLASDNLSHALSSPEVFEAMHLLGVNHLDFLSSGTYFDTQVRAYKLKLLEAMRERGEGLSEAQKQFYQNLDTITL